VTSVNFGSRSKQTLVIYICRAYRKPNGFPANDSGGMAQVKDTVKELEENHNFQRLLIFRGWETFAFSSFFSFSTTTGKIGAVEKLFI